MLHKHPPPAVTTRRDCPYNARMQNTASFEALKAHFQTLKDQHLRKFFGENPNRFEELSLKLPQLQVLADFSRQRLNGKTLDLLCDLATACGLKSARDAMFAGEKINNTEKRAVLHTALRSSDDAPVFVDGTNVKPQILAEKKRFLEFARQIREGKFVSSSGEKFTDVVNIGIGGSDLGPKMACEALNHYADGPRIHFVSNVDGTHLAETLKLIPLKTTLFLVASKTFTTQETMANAHSARKVLVDALGEEAVQQHFAAMSTNLDAVSRFGMNPKHAFAFWDFVGGRYSMWSAIGLPIAIAIGPDRFEEMLRGAETLDRHFKTAEFRENLPVLLALVGLWNVNFFGFLSQAILPYDQYLHRFSAHFQQVDMESNGKSVHKDGSLVEHQTGTVLWGEPGTNGQHAFYQLLHQGSQIIPADFIGFRHSLNPLGEHHKILMSHFLAQTEAMAMGKNLDEVRAELKSFDLSEEEIAFLAPHKVFAGNRPTTTLLVDRLSPFTLGMLTALYEQKIFVQGVLWNVNSFDQMGVELGKVLAGKILKELNGGAAQPHDSATAGLIRELMENGFDA